MEFIIQTDYIPSIQGAKKAGFQELIRCKDCEHRPTKPDDYDPSASEEGFRLEFPDAVCPAQCEGDGYYSWYPSDNFFCGYGKRKEGADQ